jgi:hypothetical protein
MAQVNGLKPWHQPTRVRIDACSHVPRGPWLSMQPNCR